jgi:hypothetical protein
LRLYWVREEVTKVFKTYHQATEDEPPEDEARHIKLRPSYTKYLIWSNNPIDLDLNGAFSEVEPNLSSDYNTKDLRPILKETAGDLCLLKDKEGTYYIWDMWDGLL